MHIRSTRSIYTAIFSQSPHANKPMVACCRNIVQSHMTQKRKEKKIKIKKSIKKIGDIHQLYLS